MIETFLKPDSNFAFIRVSGKLTDQELFDHLENFNTIASELMGTMELADCREATDLTELTVVGVLKAAKLEQGQQRNIGSKVAILVSTELTYGLARIYATIAGEHKEEVNIFYSIEEAFEWLNPEDNMQEVVSFVDSIIDAE